MSVRNTQENMKTANAFFIAEIKTLGGSRVSIFYSNMKISPWTDF